MKNTKWVRILTLSILFLISYILSPASYSVSIAQSQSTPPNVEGTEWEGPPENYAAGPALGTVQFVFMFGKQGKVTLKVLAIQSPGLTAGSRINSPTYNPVTGNPYEPALVTTPAASASSEAVGTYKQTGSSIRIEFPDCHIDAAVERNVMVGEITWKESNKKEKWITQRISKDSNSSSASAVDTETLTRSEQPTSIMSNWQRAEELMNTAALLTEQGRYREAIENYTLAISFDDNNAYFSYFFRAELKSKLQDYRGAIEDFSKCIQLCAAAKAEYDKVKVRPEDGGGIGAAAAAALRETKAETRKQRPISLAPQFLRLAYKSRAVTKDRLGDKAGACEDFRFACILENSEACKASKEICN